MLKNFFVITLLAVMLSSVGCSFDQSYRRRPNGSEDYLHKTVLKPLILPSGIKLPKQDDSYNIYEPQTDGNIGLKVDISPPLLPLATLNGAYADYNRETAVVNIPDAYEVWEKIVALLKRKNITIESVTINDIKTGKVITKVVNSETHYEARYHIYLEKQTGRKSIYVKLVSLLAGKKDILNNRIERKRYTIDFLNMIMLELKRMN